MGNEILSSMDEMSYRPPPPPPEAQYHQVLPPELQQLAPPPPHALPPPPHEPPFPQNQQLGGQTFASTLLLSFSCAPLLKQHLLRTLSMTNEELASLEPVIAEAWDRWDHGVGLRCFCLSSFAYVTFSDECIMLKWRRMEIRRRRTYSRRIPLKWRSTTRTNHPRTRSHIPMGPVQLIQTRRLQPTNSAHDSIGPLLVQHHSGRHSLILKCRRQLLHPLVRLDRLPTIALTLIWLVRVGRRLRVERTKTLLSSMDDDLFLSMLLAYPVARFCYIFYLTASS